VIDFDRVSVTYPDATAPTLTDVSLTIGEGEFVLVMGPTGCGKSTLLKCINGLVPHFTGGHLGGRVVVAGHDTRTSPPREFADVIGFVGQDPVTGFVTDTVEDELAYGMESLGVAPATMRRRVEETLDLLGLYDLRDRPLLTLSGGEQQRVAIASVLTVHPKALVLDEPTSALDPPAADEVLAALARLVHDVGLTVVVSEHRLERVIHHVDTCVLLENGVHLGPPREVLPRATMAPPVVELARSVGWSPIPLSIREARRAATDLRNELAGPHPQASHPAPTSPAVVARGLVASYGEVPALRGVDLTVDAGEIAAVMGRNGAGKSTLLSLLAGITTPTAGSVTMPGRAGLVPAEPGALLWAESVGQECADADRDAGVAPGTTRALLRRLSPGIANDQHPSDLSEGQRLCLVLAIILAPAPSLIALDEPTRGLDYATKRRLVEILRSLAADGHGVVLATHDVELVAEVADRMLVLADGEIVTEGPAREVAVSSPGFAPQVAKVFAPLPFLTVSDVRTALAAR